MVGHDFAAATFASKPTAATGIQRSRGWEELKLHTGKSILSQHAT